MMDSLDGATELLVRVAAAVAASDDATIRQSLGAAAQTVPSAWVEEVLLQSYLFAGFPRALNAMRAWRALVGPRAPDHSRAEAPSAGASAGASAGDRVAGEVTCRAVYGSMYDKLRENIRDLHPALDEWMIIEGYGKVLSRPGLDLPRRELCIVAACVASGQERQLHSHLHGALNVGVGARVVHQALDALRGLVADDRLDAARRLLSKVERH